MIIAKIQSDLEYKANQSDVDQLLELLKRKADRSEMVKEVDRLEKLIERFNQAISEQADQQIQFVKELENLKQFVEMLQRSINGIK